MGSRFVSYAIKLTIMNVQHPLAYCANSTMEFVKLKYRICHMLFVDGSDRVGGGVEVGWRTHISPIRWSYILKADA